LAIKAAVGGLFEELEHVVRIDLAPKVACGTNAKQRNASDSAP
jgi:hypothetical protein